MPNKLCLLSFPNTEYFEAATWNINPSSPFTIEPRSIKKYFVALAVCFCQPWKSIDKPSSARFYKSQPHQPQLQAESHWRLFFTLSFTVAPTWFFFLLTLLFLMDLQPITILLWVCCQWWQKMRYGRYWFWAQVSFKRITRKRVDRCSPKCNLKFMRLSICSAKSENQRRIEDIIPSTAWMYLLLSHQVCHTMQSKVWHTPVILITAVPERQLETER